MEFWQVLGASYPEELKKQQELHDKYREFEGQYFDTLHKMNRRKPKNEEAAAHALYSIAKRRVELHDRANGYMCWDDVTAIEELVYELRSLYQDA